MNIAEAWRRGYTGKGVVVSVLDDGIEREHPDLEPNYVSALGWDAVLGEGDINHKQFGRALKCKSAELGQILQERAFGPKGLERPANSIGMDIKRLIHLTVEWTGE